MKRSPAKELGVELKEDGVLNRQGDGDMRGFELLGLRMLQVGVLVGVRKFEEDDKSDEFRFVERGGVFKIREEED